MFFGPDVECETICAASAVVEFCEAETVDVPAAAVLCKTKTVSVLVTTAFCEVETAGVSSSWSDILIAKYNVHASKPEECSTSKQL